MQNTSIYTPITLFIVALLNGCGLPKTSNTDKKYDFVSSYDFSSARLQDLPWALHWFGAGECSEGPYCDYVADHHSDWSYLDYDYQGEFPPVKRSYTDIDTSTCHLTGGAFYGWLCVTNGILTAQPVDDPNARGFKLTVIEFRDVNADGYIDAVCRYYNDTGGTASSEHAVVLSRKSPTSQLHRVRL